MTEVQSPAVAASDADRVNRAFAGVGAALGLVVWFHLFSLPFSIASGVAARTSGRLSQFLGVLAMLSVVPGVLWVAKSAWGMAWRKAIPMVRVGWGVLAWTALSILAFLPVQFLWFTVLERTLGLPDLPDPVVRVGALGVVVGAPIAEELLFRGYGLARIRELAGERRALVFTALVFALLHGSWVKLPGTFAMGLFLGWLVLRTGSLWPALLGHFINNGAAFVLSRLDTSSSWFTGRWPWFLVLGATGMLCLILLWMPQVRGRIKELNAST